MHVNQFSPYDELARKLLPVGSALYDSRDPRGDSRPLDDLRFALDHFPKKLLTLVDGFNTATGQRLAHTRQRALQEFYDGMLAEVSF
jgi:uncharacterized protein